MDLIYSARKGAKARKILCVFVALRELLAYFRSRKGAEAQSVLVFCVSANPEQNRKSLILTKIIQIITNIAPDFWQVS